MNSLASTKFVPSINATRLQVRSRGQAHFNTGVGFVDVLVEVSFDDAIVVDPEAFAKRILGNLESAVDIAPEGRRKVEADRQAQRRRLKLGKECRSLRSLRQAQPDELSDLRLVVSSGRRQQAPAIDRGILMIDAGRNRLRQGKGRS